MMEVFAGFVSHADHHFGRILDTLERIGELDNTLIMIISDNGASAEGGVAGAFNEMLFFNNVPESSRRTWRGSTSWAARSPTTTTRGAGPGPATRRSGAGSGRSIAAAHRPVHRLLAGGHRGEGRGPPPVRARHRHGADGAGRARHRAAGRRSAAWRSRRSRGSASRTRSTPPTRRPATTPSTSRCSATARSTTTAGAPSARGRVRATPRRRSSGASWATRSRPRCWTSWTARAGSCTTSRRTRPSRTTWPPSTRTSCASWSRSGGRRRASTRSCRSTARCSRGSRPSARRLPKPAQPLRLLPGRLGGARRSRAPPVFNRPHTIEADVEIPGRRRRGRAAGAGRRRRRVQPSTSTTAACTTSTTTSGRDQLRGAGRPTALPDGPAHAALRVRADRRAGHPERQGRARAAGSSTSTATLVAQRRVRTRPRCSSSSKGLSCGYDFGAPVADGYEPPFAFTGTIHSVTVDVSGELITDDEAELRVLMARQ